MKKTLDFYRRLYLAKCTRGGKHLQENRISSLPDEVLLIILSWLTLKDMVKTSILSRRWLNLWVNTPVLDFDFDLVSCSNTICYRDIILDLAGCYRTMSNYFVRWVNHVLQQHKGLYLKKFRICCHIIYNYREVIDRWLEFALARKVEILELDFFSGRDSLSRTPNYVLNDCWFSSDGSKSQVLQFNLKFLKSLSLKDVNVTGEAINFFLRNCPFLERLELVGSASLVDLVISDPTLVLKYLQIKQCPLCKVLSISNFNLVSLDTTVGDLILKDLPMLVELSILGFVDLSHNATCLRQLEILKLRSYELQAFTEVSSILAQLTKLKRLVIDYMAGDDIPLIKLLSVIESCNHLVEFVLELHWISPERSSRNMWMVEGLSSLSLKLFEFKGYDGRVCDFELITNVVMNAPLLEKIIIDPCNMTRRTMNYPVQEARRFALKQIQDLREAKYIPPHVDVIIR